MLQCILSAPAMFPTVAILGPNESALPICVSLSKVYADSVECHWQTFDTRSLVISRAWIHHIPCNFLAALLCFLWLHLRTMCYLNEYSLGLLYKHWINMMLSQVRHDLPINSSIPKPQWLHRWSWGLDKRVIHPTPHNGCNYWSVLWFKFNHISKLGSRSYMLRRCRNLDCCFFYVLIGIISIFTEHDIVVTVWFGWDWFVIFCMIRYSSILNVFSQ